MPDKQKSAQKSRSPKVSGGSAQGSRGITLTPIQKVLMVNGGMAHHLRKGKVRREAQSHGDLAPARKERPKRQPGRTA